MRRTMTELEGRPIAITGAARGIGLAIAVGCARAGMRVAISDLDAGAVETALGQLGPGACGHACDVTDHAAFSAFLDRAEAELGPLYAVVNNAGVCFLGPFVEEDPDRTSTTVEVNLGAVLHGSREALRRFTPRGEGHLLNLASASSFIPMNGGASYTATKYAVLGLTRALRSELRGTGVRTTAVIPGVIRTDMTTDFKPSRGSRLTSPERVADAVVAALRHGHEERFVPREIEVLARLLQVLPPAAADGLKRRMGIDGVMRGAH
jgi:NAD(P)-dependent dehydrogenase (short-subunit alcohol dehydrogenase family)